MKPAGANYKPTHTNFMKTPQKLNNAQTLQTSMQNQRNDAHYTVAKIMSASPLDLILIMYEQLFELIPDIKKNIQAKSFTATKPDVERAQAIVDELINALDFDLDISRDLGAIYFYIRDRIMIANIRFDEAIWDHIEETLRPLYEGFKNAAQQIDATTEKQNPLKSHRTSIVAGITYGQANINEVVVNTSSGLQA